MTTKRIKRRKSRIPLPCSLPMPFLKSKEVWKNGETPFGFKCEVSRYPDFKACSYFLTNDKDLADEWVTDVKNFEETQFKIKCYSRITEVDIEYCEMCKRHDKLTPIEKGERWCMRCEDLMLEAQDIKAEEYDKDEFGD